MEDSGPGPATWQEGNESPLHLPTSSFDPCSGIEWLGNSLPTHGLVPIGHGYVLDSPSLLPQVPVLLSRVSHHPCNSSKRCLTLVLPSEVLLSAKKQLTSKNLHTARCSCRPHSGMDSSQLLYKDDSRATGSATLPHSSSPPRRAPEHLSDTDVLHTNRKPRGFAHDAQVLLDNGKDSRDANIPTSDNMLAAFSPTSGADENHGLGTVLSSSSVSECTEKATPGHLRNSDPALRAHHQGNSGDAVSAPDSYGWTCPPHSASPPMEGSLSQLLDEDSLGLWPPCAGSLSPAPLSSSLQGGIPLPTLAALQASMGAPSCSKDSGSLDGLAQQTQSGQVQSLRRTCEPSLTATPHQHVAAVSQSPASSQSESTPGSAFSPVQLPQQHLQQGGSEQLQQQRLPPLHDHHQQQQQQQQPIDTGQQDIGAPGPLPAGHQPHNQTAHFLPPGTLTDSQSQQEAAGMAQSLAAHAWQQLQAQQWMMAQHMYSMNALAATGPAAYGWMSQQLPQAQMSQLAATPAPGLPHPPSVPPSNGFSSQLPSVLQPAPDLRPASLQLSAGLQQMSQNQAAFLQMQQMHQMQQAMSSMQQAQVQVHTLYLYHLLWGQHLLRHLHSDCNVYLFFDLHQLANKGAICSQSRLWVTKSVQTLYVCIRMQEVATAICQAILCACVRLHYRYQGWKQPHFYKVCT